MNDILRSAMLVRYPRAEYALLEEVGEETGGGRRRADALVLNFWRSRGLELEGFEVKASRSDWLREKKDPSKAEALARYCDRWSIIATGPDILKPAELPPTWGLLELHKTKLIQIVKAPKLTPSERPWKFVCELVRRAQQDLEAQEATLSAAVYQRARAEIEAKAKAADTEETTSLKGRVAHLEQAIREFEEATGLNVRGKWQYGQVSEAVQLLKRHGRHDVNPLLDLKAELLRVAGHLGLAAEQINSLREPMQEVK